MEKKIRIYLIGFMGSGKTHWGKRMAQALQVPFFDLDEVITVSSQKTITEIFSLHGEEYFRTLEKEALEAVTADHEQFIISCGGGTPCFFNNIDFMKKQGRVWWLNTAVDVLVARLLKEKTKRPLLRTIADEDMKAVIIKKLQERRFYYQQANVVVDEDLINLDELLKLVTHA
ncbi:MAG: shikimate kinase [Flavihumibacter sp.]|nr:shikimate kinase [Flavihumibacter sp.]